MRAQPSIEDAYRRHFAGLVRGLAVAYDDAEAAADAVQDAFLAAERRWGRVQGYDDPVAWVRHVAVNRLRNGHRNARRRSKILASVRPVATDDLTAELLDLRAAVAALPEQMRLAVCLHYLAGCSVDEVAETLGVASGTVKSNLHDARRRLRLQLEEPADG
jgi:RNA polymerase sigma-70 factor (ECF subfamily)